MDFGSFVSKKNIFAFLEAKAARQANMQVIILDRSGNSQLTDEERNEFEVLTSFENIDLDSFCLKRKADDNLTEEVN